MAPVDDIGRHQNGHHLGFRTDLNTLVQWHNMHSRQHKGRQTKWKIWMDVRMLISVGGGTQESPILGEFKSFVGELHVLVVIAQNDHHFPMM